MPLDKKGLLDFLATVDNELRRELTMVAVGGTAMTLLNLKPSTIDIDFTAPKDDLREFTRVLKSMPHGFKIDYWEDGMVFSQILPSDYIRRSILIKKMRNLKLRALHPLDIVVTKIGRLDRRDQEDIESCIKKYSLSKNQIIRRAKKVEYVGKEGNYDINLQNVLRHFSKRANRVRNPIN